MGQKKTEDNKNAETSTQSKPRSYEAGKRRFTFYCSWDFPAEARADVRDFDNRWPTTLEFRKYAWPNLEWMRDFEDQGVGNQMEHGVLRGYQEFPKLMGEATGQEVPLLQRVDKTGNRQLLDERVIADTDTLMLVSLDHVRTGQKITPGEVQMLNEFLSREGTCLIISPHHDVGSADDQATRVMEHKHHGDWTVGGQERFSGFARSVFAALDLPVENRHGLSPARVKGTREPEPLSVAADLDKRGLLRGVSTFNAHNHLPHFAITRDDAKGGVVLARQRINPNAKPHPFVQAGNTEFNALVWFPPAGKRAGDILVADLTIWSARFGGDECVRQFWQNLAKM